MCDSLGEDQVSVSQSGSHSRSFEPRSSPILETGLRSQRMETKFSSNGPQMAEVRPSRSGFVCIKHDCSVSTVVLPVPSVTSGVRCQSLCLSTNSFAPSSAVQDTDGQSKTSAVWWTLSGPLKSGSQT